MEINRDNKPAQVKTSDWRWLKICLVFITLPYLAIGFVVFFCIKQTKKFIDSK